MGSINYTSFSPTPGGGKGRGDKGLQLPARPALPVRVPPPGAGARHAGSCSPGTTGLPHRGLDGEKAGEPPCRPLNFAAKRARGCPRPRPPQDAAPRHPGNRLSAVADWTGRRRAGQGRDAAAAPSARACQSGRSGAAGRTAGPEAPRTACVRRAWWRRRAWAPPPAGARRCAALGPGSRRAPGRRKAAAPGAMGA